jgi:hypothetical protein
MQKHRSNTNIPATTGGSQVISGAAVQAPATPVAAVDINTVRLRLNQLRTELRLAQEQQRDIVRNLTEGAPAAAQPGLEQQLASVQQQIVGIEGQITATQAQIGIAVNTHATTSAPDDYNYPVRDIHHGPDPAAVVTGLIVIFVLAPISWALARRILRRSVPAAALPPTLGEMPGRLERLEQAVDTVAIEIERISESQRFLTKLMAERQPAALSKGQST